jgi:PPR repeat family
MRELQESGVISAAPNVHCYTAVINCCAYCGKDSIEKRQALRIAIETYKEMLEGGRDRPNHITFSTMLTALRNLMPPDDTRVLAIEKVFKRCANDGFVTDGILLRLQSSLSTDQLANLVGNSVIHADGSVDMSTIPTEWSRQSYASISKSTYTQLA